MLRRKHIPRTVSKILAPYILLFALYVQFHGDYGPGGGFQAGVIFASVFILYALIYGMDNARKVLPPSIRRILLGLGVLIYAGTGVVGMLMGGNFLNYSVLLHDPLHGQHLGINVIEFGVGMAVFASMVTIFFVFAGQDRK